MKTGIALNPFMYEKWNDKIFEKLKSYGFDAVDYDLIDTDYEIYNIPEAEAIKNLEDEKNRAQKALVTINQAHGPWRFPTRDLKEEDRCERMEQMKKSIRMTHAFGCENWVVHPLMPYGIEDTKCNKEDATRKINIEFFSSLLSEAKKYGITICLENMPFVDFSLSRPDAILDVVKEINDDNFKICFDTGHVMAFGDMDIGDELRKLGDFIKVFHIHDTIAGNDYHLTPFNGRIDWEGFGKALSDIKFDGVFSLETCACLTLPDELCDEDFSLLAKKCKYIIEIGRK